jgi:5'-methylthioadenosine phosphorylase
MVAVPESLAVAAGRLAVIAGSGVTVPDLLGEADADSITTGSGAVVHDTGRFVVLARHGAGAARPAHRVDHEANLRGLHEVGCQRVLALASTGSLRPDWPVGTVVMPDDFFAPWVTPSIFDDTRGHSIPGFDAAWRTEVAKAWHDAASATAVDGGVYVQTIGPRFETPAEIRFFATVGDLVGMTIAAEAILAKELGLAYATVCVVDNLANGVEDVALTTEVFRDGVARNREQFAEDVRRVVEHLTRTA